MRLFEGIQQSWTVSMSDPRTGGVTEPPRKTKKNGVKNLKGAQATPKFLFGLPESKKSLIIKIIRVQ